MKQLTLLEALQTPDVKFRLDKEQSHFLEKLRCLNGSLRFCHVNNDGRLLTSRNKEIYDNVNAEIVEIVEIDYEKSNLVFKSKETEGWCFSYLDNSINKHIKKEAGKRLLWKTKEQCEASVAMAELSFLMAEANGDWQADWLDWDTCKHCISIHNSEPIVSRIWHSTWFLVFKTEEIAGKFLSDNLELIKKAKVLL